MKVYITKGIYFKRWCIFIKIKAKKQHTDDLIKNILINAGVEDIEKYLNPDNTSDTKLHKLPNIKKACNLVKKHINGKILQLVDSDCDGNTSGAIIYKYLKHINPDVQLEYFLHTKRVHGLTSEFMQFATELKPDLIIIADAGTNDITQREELVRQGIDLIIIDHHIEEQTTKKGGILINNHAKFPSNDINKNLTGATLSYLFCCALDKYVFNSGYAESDLKNLAMIGTIGDVADLRDNEIRNLCKESISNITCNLLKLLCYKQNKSVHNLTFNDLQFFGIISIINSIIRVGNLEEKRKLFKALIDEKETISIEREKFDFFNQKLTHVMDTYNIYEYVLEIGYRCKNYQDKIVKKEVDRALPKYDKNFGIQIYVSKDDEAESLLGLVANKLVSNWNCPVIVVKEDKEKNEFVGSLRGCVKTLKDFKSWCESTGLFTFVMGHNNAAGVRFPCDNLEKILVASNKIKKNDEFLVEKIYQKSILIKDAYIIEDNKRIFQYGIREPLFGIKNMDTREFLIEYSKCTLRLSRGGVKYIKFKVTEEQLRKIQKAKYIDAVGFLSINKFRGVETPQFNIYAMHIKQNQED